MHELGHAGGGSGFGVPGRPSAAGDAGHCCLCRSRWALARWGRCRRGGRQCGTRRRHAEAVARARCEVAQHRCSTPV
eukprot:2556585-Prymnesium_polylepis.2